MTTLSELWYLAEEATRKAQESYHNLSDRPADCLEFETTKYVSRRRFRTVAERILDNGAPYGAHTLAYRPGGELLLVRHEAVDQWVLPGGESADGESFQEAARRELHEEAGIDAAYEGLGMLGRVTFRADEYTTWGVLPLFEARVEDAAIEPTVDDPDGEISKAQWFTELPEDTRDREHLREWRQRRLD